MNSKELQKLRDESARYQQLNQELDETIQKQQLKIDRLTGENKLLKKQIMTERRVRYAAINLVSGVDKTILAQIEKLSGDSGRTPKVAKYGDAAYDTSSAENLLQTIRTADLKANYSQKNIPRPKNPIVYKTVKSIYFVPRHLVAMSFRAVLGARKAWKKNS